MRYMNENGMPLSSMHENMLENGRATKDKSMFYSLTEPSLKIMCNDYYGNERRNVGSHFFPSLENIELRKKC